MSEHAKSYHFFVDRKKYESQKESITGQEIKAIADVPPTYQLFLEEEGDTPDKPIADSEGVNLAGKGERHFFAVPPATFGTR